MADRIDITDFDEHVGCRHVLEPLVKTAIRDFFTAPPANTTQTVFVQLRTALGVAVPTITWTAARTLKAMRAYIEDEV